MKKMKRIFAALLCLCMMASVLPMGAAATGAAVEELTVNFVTSISSTGGVIKSAEKDVVYSLFDKNGNKFQQIGCIPGAWAALELGDELKAGYYDAVITYSKASVGREFNFYLAPKGTTEEISNYLKNASPIDKIDFYASSISTGYMSTLSAYVPNDGEYVLVLQYAGNETTGTYYTYMNTLQMKKIDVEFTDRVSIDFTDSNIRTYLAANDVAAPALQTDSTDDGKDVRATWFDLKYQYKFVAFDIGGIEGGDYKGELNFVKATGSGEFGIYLVPANAIYGDTANAIAYAINDSLDQGGGKYEECPKYKVTNLDAYVAGGAAAAQYWQKAEFTISGLSAGHYYLVVVKDNIDNTDSTNNARIFLQGFDMVPADFEYATVDSSAQVTGSDVLGENYAYIRKDGTDWVVNFFGGVKKTDGYSKVGFEVVYNNGTKATQESDKVYTDFRVGGQQIAAQNFGADVQWIFGGEFALNDIDTTQPIKFRAYAVAVDEEGNETTVYGKTYTATIE